MHSEPKACLFNIQKFSIHDGPGVRTTVFFKGCPLRCFWCSNPESISTSVQVLWSEKACVGCGGCVAACPASAVTMAGAVPVFDHGACTGCGLCVAACPRDALSLTGKSHTLDRVVEKCLEDRLFYEDSGGGVTLSGGEVLSQPEFARELLAHLRAEGIHTALETNGYAGEDVFRAVASEADLLLFDVKHYDEKKHLQGTGVSNATILRNLARAVADGIEVLARIPVIRGYNDSPEDAEGFGRLLAGMGIEAAQLLPFHQMGESKYAMLGLAYPLASAAPLHKEDLEGYRQILLSQGMKRVIL